MPTSPPGQPFTFHALFVENDVPVIVTGATAKVFRFGPAGNEVVLTTSSMSAVPGDTGRYQYTYSIPLSFPVGDTVYALMYGTSPLLNVLRVESSVDLVPAPTSGGLTARFIP